MYDYITTKPDIDDALQHYGIKGMKWKFRKSIISSKVKRAKRKKTALETADTLYNAAANDAKTNEQRNALMLAANNNMKRVYSASERKKFGKGNDRLENGMEVVGSGSLAGYKRDPSYGNNTTIENRRMRNTPEYEVVKTKTTIKKKK